MLSQVLEELLPQYIANKVDYSNTLNSVVKDFGNNTLPDLEMVKNESLNSNKNLYQLFNSPSLAAANSVTRTFNTKLGHLWERIAILSPNVVSPELEFGFKIVGVDSILFYDNKFYYCQLKTQKNTLTGGQSSRVTAELSPYNDALVVACIDCNCSWTYSGVIPKVVGSEFWNLTSIDYEDLLNNIGVLINDLENLIN